MSITWEEKNMSNVLSISKYELKMQLKNIGIWAIWAFAAAAALWDNFPSEANLNRLEFLSDQGYVVSRLLSHEGVLLLFGLMFLLADRIRGDGKKGTMELFMASPLSKAQYIWGKLLGNYATLLLVMAVYLGIHAVAQYFYTPGPFTLLPYVVGLIAMCIPACFFVSACSVALPAVVDIRLCYVVFSVYFLMNSDFIYIENSILRALYLFQSDMLKLVYTYESFETIMIQKLLWNLAFLLCAGLASMLLLQGNRRYWRETA